MSLTNQHAAPDWGVRKIPVAIKWGVILLFIPGLLKAQEREELVFPLDTFWHSVSARIDVVEGVAEIISSDTVRVSGRRSQGPVNGLSSSYDRDSLFFYKVDSLTIDRGDLTAYYYLPPTSEGEYFQVSAAFELDGRPLTPAPENLQGAIGPRISVNKSGVVRQITWANLLEDYTNLSGVLTVRLRIVFNGLIPGCLQVRCSDGLPTLNRTPFIIAGAVGVGLIGVGQLFDSRSDDRYEEYENFKPSESPDTDPEELYQDANGKHHTYLGLTYAGIAVLAADAAWWLVKELKLRRDRRRYEQCCRSSAVRLQPALDLSSGNAVGHIGLQLRVNF